MSFKRTANGLSNQHLFFKVDAIVFVEGGRGFTKEEVMANYFDTYSIDIQYWRGVFSIFKNDVKVEFRAIGSKHTLKEIAQDISEGKVSNVYVAMDRDFDEINEVQEGLRKVILTYGYSWENDVWQVEIVEDVLNSICAADCKIEELSKDIRRIYSNFIDSIFCGVCADAKLLEEGKSFFSRKNHLIHIEFGKKKEPVVNCENIASKLQDCRINKAQIEQYGIEKKLDSQRDCLGHLVSDFCYWMVVYLTNKIAKLPSIAKHYVNCIGIDKFIDRLSQRNYENIFVHYENAFKNL